MQYRELGRTGWNVSTISFGAWAIGGTWGKVDDKESLAALHRAVELGVEGAPDSGTAQRLFNTAVATGVTGGILGD